MKISIDLLEFKTINSYKKEYQKIVSSKILFNSFKVKFFYEDFEHAFYEHSMGDTYKGRFSRKRARRLLLIRQILNNKLPIKIVYQLKRAKPTIALICEPAECCLILLPVEHEEPYLRFVTMIAFGRGADSGPKKIYSMGKIITKDQITKILKTIKES